MNALRTVLMQLMEDNHISASAWSLKAGKSRNFVNEYLSERANDMTLGSIESLAKAIDLSVVDLLEQLFLVEGENTATHKISQIRRVLGLSIAEFSRRTGVEESVIHDIENHEVTLSLEIAETISKNLSIPLSEIL